MLNLPQEVIYHIFGFLESKQLAICSQVCQSWKMANYLLYQSVDLFCPSQAERFLQCLATNTLGKKVVRLGLLWHGKQEHILQQLISACPQVEIFESLMPVWDILATSPWQLKRLPEPKKEDLAYCRCAYRFRHTLTHLQYTIADASAFDAQLKQFPLLTSLRLISHPKFRHSRVEKPHLTLRHLEVSLDPGTLNYISHKFPHLQRLVIQQPLIQGLETHFQKEAPRWVHYLKNKDFQIVLPFSPALFSCYAPFIRHLVVYKHIEALLEITPHRASIAIQDSRWDPAWGTVDPMVYNNPLFIKNFSTSHPDLKYHYIAHTSIDVIEERGTFTSLTIGSPNLVSNGPKYLDLYLGLLYAMEDLAVYGYITNTRVKIIAVASVTDGIIRDADMKSLFHKIHHAYVATVCNPFYNIDSQKSISSKSFTKTIEAIGLSARTLDI